jgi:hypothetical protein
MQRNKRTHGATRDMLRTMPADTDMLCQQRKPDQHLTMKNFWDAACRRHTVCITGCNKHKSADLRPVWYAVTNGTSERIPSRILGKPVW